MMNMPELLCPAGTMDALRAAVHFGADAVYGGMKDYGLRTFAGNFSTDELREAVSLLHAAGKKFYLTMNIFPYDDQMEGFVQAAQTALDIGVDAAIVSDLGAIATLRERVPALPIHVSTQANTVNSAAVRHYQGLGCERIILAREVSLDRMDVIHRACPDIELETFVHGAACMSYSGRCQLSAMLTGRSANQGACTQPCRWQYAVVEQKRPGQYMPVCEDEHGTYVFSAKDLNLMPLLPRLIRAGISSLKIEGRMKTEYYVAVVTGAYRRALNLLATDGEAAFHAALPALMEELNCASHRESDTGFALSAPECPGGIEGTHQTREYRARIMEDAPTGAPVRMQLKNRICAGETLELMTPDDITAFTAPAFVRESTGETVEALGVGSEVIRMVLPAPVRAGDLLRGEVRNHRV